MAREYSPASVCVVITVLNEAATVEALLESLTQQTRQPDEVIVVDGGSTDGTMELLAGVAAREAHVKLVSAPGTNIAEGRNCAVRRAASEIVAVLDGGTSIKPSWLEEITQPFSFDETVDVVSGFFLPSGDSLFTRTLSSVIVPWIGEIDPATFLPSSRSVAFRRRRFQEAGGYPERLSHCEDLVLDLKLKEAGCTFAFRPCAVVCWPPRRNLWAFAKQYFYYARGDGEAGLWARRHAVRYAVYGLAAAGSRRRAWSRVAGLIAAGLMALHFGRAIRRIVRHGLVSALELVPASALGVLVVVVGDTAKMVGYPVGRLRRVWRRHEPGAYSAPDVRA